MEEILASIRRIISEDEAPAEAAAEPAVEPLAPAPAPEPLYEEPQSFAAEEEEDDVLELTDRVEGLEESHGDIDVYARAEPEPQPRPAPVPREAAWSGREDEPLVGQAASESAASAFASLGRTISMPHDNRTLEDVVRELLRPLLKAWLDEHLPGIVQARVDAEVERISRSTRPR
jgi:cell pole-organizing protein PopZ